MPLLPFVVVVAVVGEMKLAVATTQACRFGAARRSTADVDLYTQVDVTAKQLAAGLATLAKSGRRGVCAIIFE